MASLPDPINLLDLADGEVARFRVLKVERGETTIKTTAMPDGKVVDVLRVHVPAADARMGVAYLDITSKRLIAQITPFLSTPKAATAGFRVTARGFAPKKSFELEVLT